MQPNHAIDHSKSKIQEFSNSCLQLTLSVQWAALARFPLEADLQEGKGGQVWSLQPTCPSAGPQGAARAVLLLLLPIAAACHKATSSPVLLVMVANKLLTYLCATQITLIKFSSFKIFGVTNCDSSIPPTYW